MIWARALIYPRIGGLSALMFMRASLIRHVVLLHALMYLWCYSIFSATFASIGGKLSVHQCNSSFRLVRHDIVKQRCCPYVVRV